MAGKSMILTLRLLGESSGAKAALEETTGGASKFESGMRKAGVAAAGTLGVLGGLAKVSGDAAADLEQSSGAVESVFKGAHTEVDKLAEAANRAVGLSKNEYSELASVLGAQLKNLGVSQDDLIDTTDGLITKGADLAAMFGGTTSEAVNALSAAFRGETDPIERYGISIKEAQVKAKMAEMGMSGLTGEAEKQARTQAMLALITEQSADATGQFEREINSASGSQQIANASWENAKATLGEQLLPLMSTWAQALADAAEWVQENSGLVTTLAVVLATLAAAVLAINAAMSVYSAIQAVQTAAQWANNAAWLASPVTWIVLAIVAALALLVGGFIYAYKHSESFRDGVHSVLSAIGGWFAELPGLAVSAFNLMILPVKLGIDWLSKLPTPLEAFRTVLSNVSDWVSNAFQGIGRWVDWAVEKLRQLRDAWANMFSGGLRNFGNVFTGYSAAATAAPAAAATAAPAAAAAFATRSAAAFAATPTVAAPTVAMTGIASRALGFAASPAPARQPATYTINITTGVGDPVAIGAEVRKVMRAERARRTGEIG